MKVTLKCVRMAFPHIWEPQQPQKAGGEAAYNGSFIMDLTSRDPEIVKLGKESLEIAQKAMQQVAVEKWGAKAGDVFKTLRAKGDICLLDGATKAEYDGFDGNKYISARNKAKPAIVATRKYNGKVIHVDEGNNAYIDGQRVRDLPFDVKAPYSGCYVNVTLDIWAQDNQYGKRVNAKLLAIQFARDGESFGGGESFSDNDFDFEDGGSGDVGFGFDDDKSSGDSGSSDDGFFGGDDSGSASSGDGFFD